VTSAADGGADAALGSFPVAGTEEAATLFRQATGSTTTGAALPLTFPMCWMTGPEVRAAVFAFLNDDRVVLIHESQSFDYATPLRVGEPYRLILQARREQGPDRLLIFGDVLTAAGDVAAKVETILRLISVPEDAAA
jgi:hypothetical protein